MEHQDMAALLRWLDAHDPYTQVVLACEHSPAPKVRRNDLAVVWRGCLADAPVGLSAQLLALGARYVGVVECDRNPDGLRSRVQSWVGVTPGLVGDVQGTAGRVRRGQTLVMGQIPLPRRAMFGALGSSTLDINADEQDRLREALETLQAQGRIGRVGVLDQHAEGITLDVTDCTACGVCVNACPNSALTLRTVARQNEQISLLRQFTARCRGCGECVRLCPLQSMRDCGPIPLAQALSDVVVVLAEVVTTPCANCGAVHPQNLSQGGLCQLCAFRKENPFGAALPPNLHSQLPPHVARLLEQRL